MSKGALKRPELSLSDGPIVCLEQILNCRELRAKRQQEWLSLYHTPILSLTLVIPGEIKKSSGSLFLFETALTAAKNHFEKHQLTIIQQQTFLADTGYEALMAIDASASLLKSATIQLEIDHPLGRFWDFDVIDHHGILSRTSQQTPARTCLLCGNNAHACARSRQHSVAELLSCIETKINQFYNE